MAVVGHLSTCVCPFPHLCPNHEDRAVLRRISRDVAAAGLAEQKIDLEMANALKEARDEARAEAAAEEAARAAARAEAEAADKVAREQLDNMCADYARFVRVMRGQLRGV